jgi:hypothetical protein
MRIFGKRDHQAACARLSHDTDARNVLCHHEPPMLAENPGVIVHADG